MNPQLVILSNNNPVGLYALLESMQYFWPDCEPYILYKSDSIDIDVCYNRVFKAYSLQGKTQPRFSGDLRRALENSTFGMIMYDNMLFTRSLPLDQTIDWSRVGVVSNRLGYNIRVDEKGRPIKTPKQLVFDSNEFQDVFSYCSYSYEGDIFITQSFNDNLVIPYTQMCEHSSVITISNEFDKNGDATCNDIFMQGKKIDISPFLYIDNEYPTITPKLYFKWRK